MRPNRTRIWDRTIIGIALGALLAAGTMATARADTPLDRYTNVYGPGVCEMLDTGPSFGTIHRIIAAVQADGFTGYDAGKVLANSALTWCPQHVDLLLAFADVYASPEAKGKLA